MRVPVARKIMRLLKVTVTVVSWNPVVAPVVEGFWVEWGGCTRPGGRLTLSDYIFEGGVHEQRKE